MKGDPTGRASAERLPGRLAEGQARRAGRSGTGQDASRARSINAQSVQSIIRRGIE